MLKDGEVLSLSHSEVKAWLDDESKKKRKAAGATQSVVPELKDFYFGRKEWTTNSDLFPFGHSQDKRSWTWTLSPASCINEEELFWYYMCLLGLTRRPKVEHTGVRDDRAGQKDR